MSFEGLTIREDIEPHKKRRKTDLEKAVDVIMNTPIEQLKAMNDLKLAEFLAEMGCIDVKKIGRDILDRAEESGEELRRLLKE